MLGNKPLSFPGIRAAPRVIPGPDASAGTGNPVLIQIIWIPDLGYPML